MRPRIKRPQLWLWLTSLFAVGTLSALAATVFIQLYPSTLPGKALSALPHMLRESLASSRAGSVVVGEELETSLLTLSVTRIGLPEASRSGEGGALAEVGDKTAILRFDGGFFLMNERGQLSEAPIALPDNNFTQYQADAEEMRDFQHAFHWYRYHDLAYYNTGTRHGLLVSMTRYDSPRRCYETVIAKWDVAAEIDIWSGAESGAWEDLFVSKPCLPLKKKRNAIEGHMAGGRMLVDTARSEVILASGDYHWDGSIAPLSAPGRDLPLAQDPLSDYGKVLAIDLTEGRTRHLSRGHRNPQGLAFDGRGGLWEIEHGPRDGDEINYIVAGESYGWPEESFGDPSYKGRFAVHPDISDAGFGRHQSFRAPAMAWSSSVGPSALAYISNFHPAWNGDLLMGTLRAGGLLRLRVSESHVVGVERIPFNRGTRVRDVLLRDDGTVVILSSRAQLILLSPASSSAREADLLAAGLRALAESPEPLSSARRSQAEQAFLGCLECHRLGSDQGGSAPSLSEFLAAGVGESAFGGYSRALKQDRRDWSRELLEAYLANPASVVTGTTMPNPGLRDPQLRQDLVRLLIALNQNP